MISYQRGIFMKNLVLLGGGYGNMRIMSHILPNALPA